MNEQLTPEMQKQIDDHIKRVVDQVHEAYRPITANLAKQVAESQLDVVALNQQNGMLQKQSEAIHKQLQESLAKIREQEEELSYLSPQPDSPSYDGESNQDPIQPD